MLVGRPEVDVTEHLSSVDLCDTERRAALDRKHFLPGLFASKRRRCRGGGAVPQIKTTPQLSREMCGGAMATLETAPRPIRY